VNTSEAPGLAGERVCAIQFGHESPKGIWDAKGNLACTATSKPAPTLQTFDDVMSLKTGNRFDLVGHHIIVAAAHQDGGDANLLVGNRVRIPGVKNSKGTSGFEYKQVQLPSGALKKGYELVRLQGQRHHVFIITGESGEGGTLYRVNLRSATHRVSLKGLFRKSHGNVLEEGPSVVPIAGVEGYYLANHISKHEAIDGAWFAQTVVTADNGVTWMPIEPPHDSASGVPYACPKAMKKSSKKNCNAVQGTKLHLRLRLDGILGSKASHGILIANGQVLAKYPKDPMTTHRIETFISRDAGLSWEVALSNVCPGSGDCRHRFVFGDHGSILAAVPLTGELDKMLYTLDEGVAWHSVKLPRISALAEVTQQLEADGTSFLVVGEAATSLSKKKGTAEGLIVLIDFAGLNQRRCQNEEWAGKPMSDFEKWNPRADPKLKSLPRCFNGHTTTYVRRMRLNDCMVHMERQLLKHRKNCRCEVDDYECRDEPGSLCIKPADAVSLTVQDMCHRPGNTAISKVAGYRLADSDTCHGGVHLPEESTPCGVLKPSQPLPGLVDDGSHGGTFKAKKLPMPLMQATSMVFWGTLIALIVVASIIAACFIFRYIQGLANAKVSEYSYGRVGDTETLPESALDDEEVPGPEEGMGSVSSFPIIADAEN